LLNKINLNLFLWFWLLSNAEVALQHCSATKTTKMLSSFFKSPHGEAFLEKI